MRETLTLTLPQSVLYAFIFLFLVPLSASLAQEPAPPPAPAPPDTISNPADEDSLRNEIRNISRIIQHLRDSLRSDQTELNYRDYERDEALDEAIEDFSGVISELGRELSDLDLDISDQTISLRDKDGGGIEINIPDDLGQQISEGISSITQVILSDLPDTISWSTEDKRWQHYLGVEEERPQRRVVGGEIVKIWDDVVVEEHEEVHGSVVTVFGDATIAGRVDGDVVVVLGDLDVTDTAEIDGQIVTVLGRLDRDSAATVDGSEFVLDPYRNQEFDHLRELFTTSWVAFFAKQLIFLMVAFLVILLLVIFPANRRARIEEALQKNPTSCLGYGLLVTLLGHIVLVLLFGVLVFTLIGIPVALLLLLAMVFIGLLAVASVALEVGRRLSSALRLDWQQDWLLAMLGLLVLHSFTFIGSLIGLWHLMAPLALFFQIVGVGIKLLVYCFGIGALVLSRFGTRNTEVLDTITPQVEN